MDVLDKFLRNVSYKFPKGYPDMNNDQDIALIESILLNEFEIDLSEVALSPTQLKKPYPPRNEFADKYKDRGERFLEKIINGDDFELNDESTIKIDVKASQKAVDALKNKDYDVLSGRNKIFVDTEGNTYSLSQFKKTSEFGSGSGMGGGAAQTAIQESTQSVVNSIAYGIKNSQITSDDLTDENIEDAYNISDVSATLEEVKQFIKEQTSWTNTLVKTANILYKEFPSSTLLQHRGSSFVDSIYNAYKTAKSTANLSMQADKWNPADIWMVEPGTLNTEFPTEISELNALIADLFSENKLIGVSLKKLGNEAKLSTYNMSEENREGYTFVEFDSRPTNNNTVLIYSDGSITFRTFNFATNFAGEIKGKTAAQGKIGQGAINDVLKSFNKTPLLPPKEIQTLFNNKDKGLIADFYKNYNKIVEGINEDDFNELLEERDLNYLVSKYLSTKLASIILDDTQNQDEIVSDMIRYASSSTKSSSVFVKVS